jgi:uncharacterized integral membrane protein
METPMRRALQLLIFVPLALIGLALAVANRHAVTVSFDPFSAGNGGVIIAPLFIILIIALICGVVIGGFSTWLAQGKYRRALRDSRAESARFRSQVQR